MDDQITSPAVRWVKSKYSGGNDGACVEIAGVATGDRLVRDSKLGDSSPVLTVPAGQFTALLDGIKTDRI